MLRWYIVVVLWAASYSSAISSEQICRGANSPPLCSVSLDGVLIIQADGSAELLSTDMREDAVQEALLNAKSQIANVKKALHCSGLSCKSVGVELSRCPRSSKSKIASGYSVSGITWEAVCETKSNIVVRATATIRLSE